MVSSLSLLAATATACILSIGCESTPSLTKGSIQPLPALELLPAWTKAAENAKVDEDARTVLVESKFVELTYDAQSHAIPAKLYQKRLNDAERQSYLRSLMQTKEADLMSAPSVVTYEGQLAKTEVGRQFVYPKDPRKPSESTTELIGVSNHVRAWPSADGKRIKLDVLAQVKELKGFHEPEPGVPEPVIETRRAGSTVDLADGETIVYGGLISERQQEVEDKVPFLGDIPLLGRAFRKQQTLRFKRELIVMVTPKLQRGSKVAHD